MGPASRCNGTCQNDGLRGIGFLRLVGLVVTQSLKAISTSSSARLFFSCRANSWFFSSHQLDEAFRDFFLLERCRVAKDATYSWVSRIDTAGEQRVPKRRLGHAPD